jgi:holo-[acyl-carrier protein] synthase
MLYGIGCDLCAAARIAESLAGAHGAHFAARVFGPAERVALGLAGAPDTPGCALPRHIQESAAADFAAKEAFLKAAGTGLAGFSLAEIEAVRLPSGAPVYRFSGPAAAWMEENRLRAHLSLSHEGGSALAFCVLEYAGENPPAGGA